jgi:hypothetical protein
LSSLASIRWAEVVHAPSIFYPSVFVSVLAARVLKKKLWFRPAANWTNIRYATLQAVSG